MEFQTIISRKTPKTKRPVDKKVYALVTSLKKRPVELKKGKKFTIGRASKNSLILKGMTISEVHASLKWDKSAFKVRDERSTNGTYVNNKRIATVTSLKDGDRLRFGKYVLRFSIKKIREKVEEKPGKKKPAPKKKKAGAAKTKKRVALKPKKRVAPKRPVRKTAPRKTKRR